jgi:hypothetical protein
MGPSAQNSLSGRVGTVEGVKDAVDFLKGALSGGPRSSAEILDEGAKQSLSHESLNRAARLLSVMKHPGSEHIAQIWELLEHK